MEELKETVKEEFMPWVSQYLVMKRVSIEPNFHSLYSNFLDTLKNPEFVKMVLNETYRNIKVNLYIMPYRLHFNILNYKSVSPFPGSTLAVSLFYGFY